MNGLNNKSLEKAEAMASFKIIYQKNREMQTQSYQGYNFTLKSPGRKYYNEAKEIQRFCFDKWKEGKKQREIAEMLGIHRITVAGHINNYCKNKK